MNQLEQLKAYTTVVADTGNFLELAQFRPQDATTNPSLILKAVKDPLYAPLLEKVVASHPRQPLAELVDDVLVAFGLEILQIVPGRVSTEVDARLSFDAAATVQRARSLVQRYEAAGIARDRVLIKIASTWEGIQAAAQLEREGIQCNLTLLFAFCQAVASANARVRLISPFVGRIYDWYKQAAGSSWVEEHHADERDPGVASVRRIFHYFKRFGVATQIMGASFRNAGQIRALAGCDLLTISPELLGELARSEAPLERALSGSAASDTPESPISHDEAGFRAALEQDVMASEKLTEGIRKFVADTVALEDMIEQRRSR